jgi:glycosyltransferase involved in cell wall biosynthesis
MDMPAALRWNGRTLGYFVRWLLENAVVPRLDVVITNSDYMKGRLEREYRTSNIRRLYYAAQDYRALHFLWNERVPSAPVKILFVKGDFIRGGLAELLMALRQIPDQHFVVTIAGPSKQMVYRKLGREIERTRNADIHCVGPVYKWEEMYRFYSTHHLLCVPSRREALGIAIAEAVASGLPVVTTDAGGIPEVMNGDANGFVSRPGDIRALAENIRSAYQNVILAQNKTAAGREFVMRRFSLDAMLNNLMDILIDAKNSGRNVQHRQVVQ